MRCCRVQHAAPPFCATKKTHKNTNEFVLIFEIYIFHFPTNGRHHGEQKPTDLFLASSINLRPIIFVVLFAVTFAHMHEPLATQHFAYFHVFFRPKKCRAKKTNDSRCLETSHRIAINYCRFVIIFHSVWKRMHIQSSFLVKRKMWRTNVKPQTFGNRRAFASSHLGCIFSEPLPRVQFNRKCCTFSRTQPLRHRGAANPNYA